MINYYNILKCFDQVNYRIVKKEDTLAEFFYLNTLYNNMIADNPLVLYVINENDLRDIEFKNGVSVLILTYNLDQLDFQAEGIKNLIYVEQTNDRANVMIKLNNLFYNQYQVGFVLSKIENQLKNEESMDNIINVIAEFFKAPIALLDMSFNFIAKSSNYVPDGNASTFKLKQEDTGFSKEHISFLKEKGIFNAILKSNETINFHWNNEVSYYTPITINGVKVAFFVIYLEESSLDYVGEYSQFLYFIADMLSIGLHRNNYYLLNKGNYFNYIFTSIINKTNIDFDDVKRRLAMYHYELEENSYLFKINIEELKQDKQSINRMADSIRSIFRNSFYVFNEGELFFWISRKNNDLITEYEYEELNNMLALQNLKAAYVGPFYKFTDINTHLDEVRLTYSALNKFSSKALIHHEEYQIKSMIFALQEHNSLDMFYYKPLLRLYEYDEVHNTCLVETLKCYLSNLKNIMDVCNLLYIHKNTLYKRLSKINEIMQCDVNDGNIIMKIELTFEMIEINNSLKYK